MDKRLAALLVSTLLMTACGGRPADSSPNAGFINHTLHSDAQLQALWSAAQQTLSQQIDLNPLQRELYNSAADIAPGDDRVWSVSPGQLTVSSQADVPSPTLLATTGMVRPDPTGLIACPQPCNVHYAPAYSLFTSPPPVMPLPGSLRRAILMRWCSMNSKIRFCMLSDTTPAGVERVIKNS